ncbi:MAG TPA: DUF177 domain-containing protein [Anaeromyxobacteraceae bacterium]|nr:DUF177 domain-containing protein [Anaeromyxobacteraceae bacterium]
MRVNIDEIREGGLARSWAITRELIDELVSDDRAQYRAVNPLQIEARLERIERRVFVRAHGQVLLSAPCGRCLVPVGVHVPFDLEVTFVPGEEAVGQGEGNSDDRHARVAGSFEPAKADEEVYTGKVLDLDPIVREHFLLALPAYPVCKEGCRGLCQVCGTNLNERECDCDRRVPDPRWAGLEKFKVKR